VYQTIEFKRFAALVPFAHKYRLERFIVGAAKNMELQVCGYFISGYCTQNVLCSFETLNQLSVIKKNGIDHYR
jgi:hypothetical protein